jgi:hypothetical protein
MKRLWCAALLVAGSVVWIAGCSHSPEAIRARQQERARIARCYSIEVYEFGMQPPRRYRVLGVIGVDGQDNPALRTRELQQRACQLGADAIMDVRESVNGHEFGETQVVMPGGGSGPLAPLRSVTAVAIAYLDPVDATPATPSAPAQ